MALVPENRRATLFARPDATRTAVGYWKSAFVEKARRYFSMCMLLMIGQLCTPCPVVITIRRRRIMSVRLIDSLATTPALGGGVF